MNSNTESVAARINAASKTKIELAAEECDLTISAYLERVIEDHIDRNPNDLQALQSHATHDKGKTSHSGHAEQPNGFVEEMLEELE